MQQPQKVHQPPRVPEHNNPPKPTPRVHMQDQVPAPAPRVNPKKDIDQEPVVRRTRSQYQTSEQPIARRTQSQLKQALTVTQAQAAQQKYPKELLALWCTPETSLDHLAMPVLDPNTVTPCNNANCASIPSTNKYGRHHTAMNYAVSAKALVQGITDPKNNASPGQKH